MADRARFDHLLAGAVHRVTLPFAAPSEAAYLAAGRWLVDESEILFAIWDGRPAAGAGGTGDIAAYALRLQKRLVRLDPFIRQVSEAGDNAV